MEGRGLMVGAEILGRELEEFCMLSHKVKMTHVGCDWWN